MGKAANVVGLLESVERLPEQDQDLLLKLVRLLTAAPEHAQTHAIRMLGEVIAIEPETRFECMADLQDIVVFLESSLVSHDGKDWRSASIGGKLVSVFPEPTS